LIRNGGRASEQDDQLEVCQENWLASPQSISDILERFRSAGKPQAQASSKLEP
jgi:hypothetical protein